MLEQCKNAQERWGGVHQLIDKWLNDGRLNLDRPLDMRLQETVEDLSSFVYDSMRAIYILQSCLPSYC